MSDTSEKASLAPSLPSLVVARRTRIFRWAMGPSRTARWSRVFFRIVFPMFLVVGLGIGIGWSFRTRTFSAPEDLGDFDGRSLYVSLDLESVDPLLNGGTIIINWYIGDDDCWNSTDPNATPDPEVCPPVNIFMGPNGFASSANGPPSTPANNNVPSTAIFEWTPTTDGNADQATFTTALSIGTRSNKASDTILNYPFDRYLAEVWAYAQVNGTNDTVGLIIADTRGAAFGFDTRIPSSAELKRDYGLNIPEDNLLGEGGNIDVLLDIRRTVLVRAYVVTIIVAMWLITLLLLAISIKAALFMYNVDMAILVAPVATLFAFTTLRTALPGAPSGFGAIIDFVGTLPSLAALIAITVVCLIHVLVRSTSKIVHDLEV
ncbi:hypothetical protein PsYK624_078810 [Phanerochaete sordida]|uniref:DUF4436 domain-containing protein n=1 Tax=Phanerochaete sordida TaxID=48140 RepID=A0A9P3GBQ8_9APHY|nr:hypothetical protein PsYK624_078810 [Phanerochaete sordida]